MTTTSINISTSQQMHRLQFVIVVASTFQDLSLAPFFFPSRRDRSEKKKGSQPVHGRRMVSSLSLSLSLTHTHTHTHASLSLDWIGLVYCHCRRPSSAPLTTIPSLRLSHHSAATAVRAQATAETALTRPNARHTETYIHTCMYI